MYLPRGIAALEARGQEIDHLRAQELDHLRAQAAAAAGGADHTRGAGHIMDQSRGQQAGMEHAGRGHELEQQHSRDPSQQQPLDHGGGRGHSGGLDQLSRGHPGLEHSRGGHLAAMDHELHHHDQHDKVNMNSL